MALHLTVLSFLVAFHKDRVWGHCCLPFIPANCLKSSNTIYLKHMPMLMTLSFTCRLVLTRLLIRMMRSLPIRTLYIGHSYVDAYGEAHDKLNDEKTEFMLIGTKQYKIAWSMVSKAFLRSINPCNKHGSYSSSA